MVSLKKNIVISVVMLASYSSLQPAFGGIGGAISNISTIAAERSITERPGERASAYSKIMTNPSYMLNQNSPEYFTERYTQPTQQTDTEPYLQPTQQPYYLDDDTKPMYAVDGQ